MSLLSVRWATRSARPSCARRFFRPARAGPPSGALACHPVAECHAESHRARDPVLLTAHGRRDLLRPAEAALALPFPRRHRGPFLWHDPADPAGVRGRRAHRRLRLALPPPPGHVRRRLDLAMGDRVLRRRLHLLLVAPALAPGERPLGRPRSAPPERGLQLRRRAAAGGAL